MSGNGHVETLDFREPPQRVVSLVPSMTDSLYELGVGTSLVGVTSYCPSPLGSAKAPAIVGGTKDFDPELVSELKPDLIITNQEENDRQLVEALEGMGLPVWLTFPQSVEQALAILYTLVRLFRLNQAIHRIQTLEVTLDWAARSAADEPISVFCPIWLEQEGKYGPWWMVANRQTYHYDLLLKCNGRGLFGERERRYPLAADLGQAEAEPAGDRDQRYPRVSTEEVAVGDPEVILLPSEPFLFRQDHIGLIRQLLPDSRAVKHDRIHLVDGRLISWHGTKMAAALAELPQLLQPQQSKRRPEA
jgi:ABC-type Fe3+-hydroxamate transport system substrate-binding protein